MFDIQFYLDLVKRVPSLRYEKKSQGQQHIHLLILNLEVRPNCKMSKHKVEPSGIIKLSLRTPPVEGAANQELRVFLSQHLGTSISDLEILKGECSRQKTLGLVLRKLSKEKELVRREKFKTFFCQEQDLTPR